MKLLILGLLAIALLAAGSRRDWDCSLRWQSEARERAIEARREARERAREFRAAQKEEWRAQREELRAWRDAAREERDRIRHEIRDWRYTY